jgi:hypothetical protein
MRLITYFALFLLFLIEKLFIGRFILKLNHPKIN